MCDKLDAELLAASQEAMESGSITPLVKKELWLKIQIRRLSEGKEELVVPPTPSLSYQVTQAEQAKKRRRQEQNRRAAKRFRKKAKNKRKALLERLEDLGESNRQLEEDRIALIREKNQTLLQLCHHLQVCQTCPGPSKGLPPFTHHVSQDLRQLLDDERHNRREEAGGASLAHCGTSSDNLEAEHRHLTVGDTSGIGEGKLRSRPEAGHRHLAVGSASEITEETLQKNLEEEHCFLEADSSLIAPISLKRKGQRDQHRGKDPLEDLDQNTPASGSFPPKPIQLRPDDAVPSTSHHLAPDTQSVSDVSVASLKGFCRGVMFLQIVDGRVCIQPANGQIGRVGLKNKTVPSTSAGSTSPSTESAILLGDLVPPATSPAALGTISTAKRDQKRGSGKRKLLYRLDTSSGLPFFVMDNCLQDTNLPEYPRHTPDAKTGLGPPRAKKEKKSVRIKTTKRGRSKADRNPPTNGLQGKQNFNNVAQSTNTSLIYEDPDQSTNTSLIYEDPDHEGKFLGKDRISIVTSDVTDTSGVPQRSNKNVIKSLRDETNIRLNNQYNLSPTKRNITYSTATTNSTTLRQSCSKKRSTKCRGEATESYSEGRGKTFSEVSLQETNVSLPSQGAAPAHCESASRLTEASVHDPQYAFSFSSAYSLTSATAAKFTTSLHASVSHPQHDQPDASDIFFPRQEAASPLTHTLSKQPPPAEGADSSSGSKYDVELQDFLTGCFESLDARKSKAEEERQPTAAQGLVLLTSVELRCLATGTSQTCASTKLDLSNLDSLRLLKILKDCGGGGGGHSKNTQQGDGPTSENSSRSGCFPVCLFSGLKSLMMDSENNIPMTTEVDALPLSPVSSLPPTSSQSGYYLLPVLLNSGRSLPPPSADPVLAANPTLSGSRRASSAESGSDPALTQGVAEDGIGHSSAVPGPQSLVAGQASGSPSGTEYSRLVESLIQSIASGHV